MIRREPLAGQHSHCRSALARCVRRALLPLLLAVFGGAAHSETLIIEGALDRDVFEPVLALFQRNNPDITLDYRDRSTLMADTFARTAKSAPDVVISSAMPWQMALSNEGFAQRVDTEETRQWPAWAKWREELFGFTFEPIVMAYRLDLAAAMKPPSTHQDLLDLLLNHREELQGKVVTYSPLNSGIGDMLSQQDARYTPKMWDLVAAMGQVGVHESARSKEMLEGLSSGKYWLAYNILGSYAMVWAQNHPEVVVQVPNDYSLVMMRTAFVHREAEHPQAAYRFVGFLLSQEGQSVMAGETPLFSVRPDVVGPYTAQRLRDEVGDHLYPIPLNASLLAFVDPLRRAAFLKRWQETITPEP
ncbi:ABC transporter substrate-binding protein [Marinobacterium lutimaris]|uniref:Iron(III) transport system substrate-binding protein/two-component system, OmpR family, sensor histidine kinase TctE n=1 Tax=Marinobacterium lutimaris TaxID=568106 RepID=A0A1H6DE70_9GAMM|nr:ABC transporter substrate-binding protein [Marinobacterium lutimaris]SEG82856.1 iron(III) transport system substrate-binding protein/two-component system, OmpR family, sensor histidine kinase TctE [Marinobacterium lutimaris]